MIVCFEFEWELDPGFDDLSSALQACAAGRPLGAVDGALTSFGLFLIQMTLVMTLAKSL